MNTSLIGYLKTSLDSRVKSGRERQLRLHRPEQWRLNLADNDYLRLSEHPEVIAAGKRALERYGASASASPLITGYGEAHEQLLKCLQSAYGMPHGMLWNTGYSANQAVLSHLPQRGDIVLADRLIHNSMIHGILGSGARLMRYRHLDMEHLESLLEKQAVEAERVFVVTESVFSMDGDYPEMRAMKALKARYDFIWILDEAHAIGCYGERGLGLAEEADVVADVDVLVGTLGKGLGSMGAFTLFHEALPQRYLVNEAGEFIYSTYLAPVCAAMAEQALVLAMAMREERATLKEASRDLRQRLIRAGLRVPTGDSPIIPIIVGSEARAMQAAQALEAKGIRLAAIRPPTVPEGESRLRLSLHAKVGKEALSEIALALEEVLV